MEEYNITQEELIRHDLPGPDFKENEGVKCKDIWLYMDSEATVEVSPAMFNEFFFPYYQTLAETFGLLSYGQ